VNLLILITWCSDSGFVALINVRLASDIDRLNRELGYQDVTLPNVLTRKQIGPIGPIGPIGTMHQVCAFRSDHVFRLSQPREFYSILNQVALSWSLVGANFCVNVVNRCLISKLRRAIRIVDRDPLCGSASCEYFSDSKWNRTMHICVVFDSCGMFAYGDALEIDNAIINELGIADVYYYVYFHSAYNSIENLFIEPYMACVPQKK
jgi:hypothetical protein